MRIAPAVLRPLIGLLLAVAAAGAAADGWIALLKDTPAEKFDDEDLKMHLEAARKALNDTAVGESVSWKNAATGAAGTLTVQKAFEWKNAPCRELKVQTEAHGRKGSSNINLCRVDGRWRGVSPTELAKKS